MRTLVLRSKNSKLGTVSATYLPLTTCPDTCSHKGRGCYAEQGHVGMHARRKEKEPLSPQEWAWEEFEDLTHAHRVGQDLLPLRLHVSGDVVNSGHILYLSTVVWNKPMWTYTHNHRLTCRKNWGKVSVLASCDTLSDIEHALDTGYSPAVTVSKFESSAIFRPVKSSVWLIPCPNQTKGITCDQCRLCWDDSSLRRKGLGIAFASHGPQKRKLKVIQ